jgi:hypothetical protein
MMNTRILLAAALLLSLISLASASIDTGESSLSFLSIWFGEYPNLVESGTSLHWTYDISGSYAGIWGSSCTGVKASTGYVIIPYSYYLNHKTSIDAGIKRMEAGWNVGAYITPTQRISDRMQTEILSGDNSYSAKELSPWQNPSSCNIALNIPMQGDGLNKYFLVGGGCIYNNDWLRGAFSSCELATATVEIYNCGTCGSNICLLDYLTGNTMAIDGYYNTYGANICVKKGTQGGFCENTQDCVNLVSNPGTTLTASHSTPYYMLSTVRCEKDTPTDSRIAYVNGVALLGGGKGTCEMGAESTYDCSILGAITNYPIKTLDGGYNGQRSGWAVDDGKCILGECNGFSACYDLYNSIYYDCSWTAADSGSYGTCKQTQWTTAQIQTKCEAGEGTKPQAGYAWYVDASGKCYQDKPTTSECSKASDCSCKTLEIGICQQITTGTGTYGKCYCQESGGGVTPSTCGDHVCDYASGENSVTCPVDCATVPTTPIPIPDPEEDNSWVWMVAAAVLFLFILVMFGVAYKLLKKR